MEHLYYPILFIATVALLFSMITPIAIIAIGYSLRQKELGNMHRRVDEQLMAVIKEQRTMMETEAELLQHLHMLEASLQYVPNIAMICLDQSLRIIAIGGTEIRHFSLYSKHVGMSVNDTTTILTKQEAIEAYKFALAGEPSEIIVPTMHESWRFDIQPLRNGQIYGVCILASRHAPL